MRSFYLNTYFAHLWLPVKARDVSADCSEDLERWLNFKPVNGFESFIEIHSNFLDELQYLWGLLSILVDIKSCCARNKGCLWHSFRCGISGWPLLLARSIFTRGRQASDERGVVPLVEMRLVSRWTHGHANKFSSVATGWSRWRENGFRNCRFRSVLSAWWEHRFAVRLQAAWVIATSIEALVQWCSIQGFRWGTF